MQVKKMSNTVVKVVPYIVNPHETSKKTENQPSWVGSGYTKLHIWSLTEYS